MRYVVQQVCFEVEARGMRCITVRSVGVEVRRLLYVTDRCLEVQAQPAQWIIDRSSEALGA